MNEVFRELANWINRVYDVKVLNICYETIVVAHTERPRLEIVFETRKESELFKDENSINYNSKKQEAISTKFSKLLKKKRRSFFNWKNETRYCTDNLLVMYSDFSSIAKSEVNNKVTKEEIEKIKNTFVDDNVWDISNFFGSVTILFYTDEQVENNRDSELKAVIEKEYLSILKKYDEFGYYDKDGFCMMIDSKENFDNNYDSNWYYYYK